MSDLYYQTEEEGIIKVHHQEDQEDLYRLCDGMMNTLIETERGVKYAASDLISKDILDQFRPDKDHFLIHCVAMGDTETYGPNKNADGWPKEALQRKHQTFVKNGHFFREHRNRDPKNKIGDIKYAAFDPKGMHRVELLMWGHKGKAAKEYAKAKEGKELSFSMSARVPDDVCSCCSNRAKSASLYCDCLKNHALQYLPRFKKYAYAINEEPTFFDNSAVNKPADRIARYLEYKFHDSDMRKAAAAQQKVILGTEWAEFEGVCVPSQYSNSHAENSMLEKLAAEESYRRNIDPKLFYTDKKAAFAMGYAHAGLREDATDTEMELFRSVRPGTLFRELAKKACVLSFPTFCAYATGKSVSETLQDPTFQKAASDYLPRVFTKLATVGGDTFAGMFKASDAFSSSCDDRQHELVTKLATIARKFSIEEGPVKSRITDLVIKKASGEYIEPSQAEYNDVFTKSASANDGESEVLANAYANYQINALSDIQRLRGSDSVGEPELSLLVSSNNRIIFH